MLVAAQPFILRNIHRTVMMNLLRSTIGTKFSARFGDLIVAMVMPCDA